MDRFVAQLLLLLLLLAAPRALGQDIGCFVPGYCDDSTQVGISFSEDSNGCLGACKNSSACFYFTYSYNDDICVEFAECNTLVNADGSESVSGYSNCDPLVCGSTGECHGSLLGIEFVSSEDECLDACVVQPDCTWWSFNNGTSTLYCSLLSDNLGVTQDCTDCSYGQRECREGAPATDAPPTEASTTPGPDIRATLLVFGDDNEVDVIDLDGKTCDPVKNLPIPVTFSLSFTINGGTTPVVCDGYDTQNCYKYDGSDWQQIASTSYSRYYSAVAQIDEETAWVIGGYYNGPYGNSETYYSQEDVWITRGNLPETMASACAVTLNENDVYISGDYYSGPGNNEIYVHDWSTGTAQYLTSSVYSHKDAICGIAISDDRGPEYVIAGNYDTIEIYTINTNTSMMAGNLPSGIEGAASVQYGNTFLFMGGSTKTSIYEWESDTRSFIIRPEKLPRLRENYPSAVMIDGTILNCA